MKDKKEVRVVSSKRDSVCAETGEDIHAGEKCLFDPASRQVFSQRSKRFKDWLVNAAKSAGVKMSAFVF